MRLPPPWGWNSPAPQGSPQTSPFGPRSLVKVKVSRAERKLCFSFLSKATSVGGLLALSQQGLPNAFRSCLPGLQGPLKSGLSVSWDGSISGSWAGECLLPGPTLGQLGGLGQAEHLPHGAPTRRRQIQASQVRNEMCAHTVTFNCVLETHVRSTCGFTYSGEVITFQAVLCYFSAFK